MKSPNARRLLNVGLSLFLIFGVIGCGSKVSGKYVAAGGVLTIDFESGQATVSSMTGQSETCTYTVSGSTVTIHSKEQGDLALNIMQDGTLQGNGLTFTKAAQ
jgi:hypothetical protein